MYDCVWSFCLFVIESWRSNVIWSHNTTSKPPHYFKFLFYKASHMFPLASSTSFTYLWIFGSHYNRVMDSVHKFTASVRAMCYREQNLWSWKSFPQLPKSKDCRIISSWIKQLNNSTVTSNTVHTKTTHKLYMLRVGVLFLCGLYY
jgi:hypothetical protein